MRAVSVSISAALLALSLAGCGSDQSQPNGIGNVDMTVTLAAPPSGPNEQIDEVFVELYCNGVDPILGVARPPESNPETFTINTATSQGPEPKNTIGLLEKQGLPAGPCFFSFYAVSNTGNTECTGDLQVQINTNETTQTGVVLACIHTPRFGGVRTDGTFNQCAEYRQILVTPTTQAIGNLVDVATEVYDPDADDVTVSVTAAGACGNVQYSNADTAASCETVSGCEAVISTVECTDVGPCQITVAVSDDGFDSCTGFLPDGSNNDAARHTIVVDCTAAQGLCAGVTCPDAGECVTNVCDPADGECKPRNDDIGTSCDLGPGPDSGVCDGQGVCVECNLDAECDAGETCVNNICEAAGLACDYVQDFEALDPADPDALANDGWLYFGSVFDGTGAFKFQFGPLPAPTTSGQVSAIASGEGGPDQGNNQLVVFSNYDCCDPPNQGHFNGTDLVFTAVFQSDSILATDIGRTFTLQFDAKRGNIEGASTAQAFVRTLDPDAGFIITSNAELDVTDLPVDWGTYSITLTLSDPDLEGQILQFGFKNFASNFEGSANFYDNITFGPQDCIVECEVDADCPDDGNECTAEVCSAGSCESVNVPDGTACNNNTGTCNAGVCRPTGPIVCEYEQDFEGLDPANPDALANEQWLYFGNVFAGDGSFKFGFGPFPAPTTSGQISAIATGEGGLDQGNQQLVVFSNYDCCDPNQGHFNGTDRVGTLVYQDINPILATDIGRTFTFTFDAKRGNIGGNTTAEAYIQTLDPDAGFAITSRVALDTTNLPVDWGTYSITLDVSDPALEGQILQFGFTTTASNFEPAGNFYDNISFCAPGGGGGPGIERRPLPGIYFTGNAINYGPYRGDGPGTGDVPSDANILEDLQLMQTAGYDLIRLFGGDAVSERILQLAEANFPEMQFQQGLFLEGLAPGPAQDNCDSQLNDNQVATAIRLANTYSNVATVSVGNETSFFSAFMPLNCLEGYIRETRNNVTQPVTADDDYTFYANFFGRAPDGVLREIDFVAIHMYPITNYRFWDWRQEGVPAGPPRAEAMMNESLAVAQANYQAVYDYQYRDATGTTVTIGETIPIVVGETGWKWRQTNLAQDIETYAGNPVNARWYSDLMRGWERTPGGPPTIFIFVAFDEAWKGTDDGWGFWDELRMPNYVLCDTPAGFPCNDPVYQGAGFFSP